VVLAKAVELDVLHDDHAIGLLRKDRVVDQLYRIDAVAGGEESQCGRDALRSTREALALRILADLEQELADERFDLVFIHIPFSRRVRREKLSHADRERRRTGAIMR